MHPYQLLKGSESGLELSCAGRLEPQVPWFRVSELLPLSDVTQSQVWRHLSKPPLHGSIKNAVRAQAPANRIINIDNVIPFTSGRGQGSFQNQPKTPGISRRIEDLKYRISLDVHDPYGRESWYSGSCVKVRDDLVFFTGNDGYLRVSRMTEDDRGVFDDTPGKEVKIPHGKLSFERIRSLHTSEETSSNSYHVAARRRHGISVYSVTEADQVRRGPSLPCSQGLAAACWLGEDIATLSSNSMLDTWDLGAEAIVTQFQLNDEAESLAWGWADLASGHHPRSVLVAERTEVRSVDTSCGARLRLELGLRWNDHVRAVEGDTQRPHCYIMTDEKLLLCDLRQTRGPLLSRRTAVGTWSPAANFCRRRTDERDWVVMGDRWGDMKVCVMDWTHDTCSTWQKDSDQLTLRCVDTCPRVLGDVTHVGSWRETVARGRELGGDWLDPPVEQRAGLRFNGYDLIKERSGNIVILAVNVMGDLFGKKLTLTGMGDEDSYEDDTDEWLEVWGQDVVRKSCLPVLNLYRPAFFNRSLKNPITQYGYLPIAVKNQKWEKRHNKKIRYYKKLLKSEKLRRKTNGESPAKKTKLLVAIDNIDIHEVQSAKETDHDHSKREDMFAASKVGLSRNDRKVGGHPIQGFPSVTIADWPEEFVDTREMKYGNQGVKRVPSKCLNIVKANKALKAFYARKTSVDLRSESAIDRNKLRLEKPLRDHQVRSCLKSDWTSARKSEELDQHVRSFTSYVDRKRTDRDGEHGGPNVLLPQFDKLNIGDYDEDSHSTLRNAHSSKILKIMLGDLDSRIGEETYSGVTSGDNDQGSVSASEDIGPPQVTEDPSYAMDNFWADLGVDAPPPSSQGDRRMSNVSVERQEDGKDVDLSDLNLGDEDDFEL